MVAALAGRDARDGIGWGLREGGRQVPTIHHLGRGWDGESNSERKREMMARVLATFGRLDASDDIMQEKCI